MMKPWIITLLGTVGGTAMVAAQTPSGLPTVDWSQQWAAGIAIIAAGLMAGLMLKMWKILTERDDKFLAALKNRDDNHASTTRLMADAIGQLETTIREESFLNRASIDLAIGTLAKGGSLDAEEMRQIMRESVARIEAARRR